MTQLPLQLVSLNPIGLWFFVLIKRDAASEVKNATWPEPERMRTTDRPFCQYGGYCESHCFNKLLWDG